MQKGLESLAFIFALPHGDPFIGGIQKSTPPPPNCPKLKLFRSLCLLTFLTFFQLCRDHFLQAFASKYYAFCYFIELLRQSLKRFIVVLPLYIMFKRTSLCITHLLDLNFDSKALLERSSRSLKMIS